MPNIPEIQIGSTTYTIKDAVARQSIEDLREESIIYNSTISSSDDINYFVSSGIWYANKSDSLPVHWPSSTIGTLIVINTVLDNNPGTMQTIVDYHGNMFVRYKRLTGWLEFKKIASSEESVVYRGVIQSTDDIDAYVTPGIWHANILDSLPVHWPSSTIGTLIVNNTTLDNNSGTIQAIVDYHGNMFVRYKRATGWFEFKKIASSEDIENLGAQVNDLETCIDNVEAGANEIANSVNQITDTKLIRMIPGKYINLSGATVSMENNKPAITGDASAGFAVGMMECSEGDVFTVNGHGGSTARLWGFVDDEGNILSVSAVGITRTDNCIEAPADAAWIIVHTNDGQLSYKGYLYEKNWPDNTINLLNHMPKVDGTMSTVTFTWSGNTCVVNGTPTGAAWNFLVNGVNEPVPKMIVPGEKYYLHFEEGAGGNVAFAFVWRNEGTVFSRDYYYNDAEIIAPQVFDGVSLALVVRSGYTASNERITCKLFKVSGAVKKLDNDITMIKSVIADSLPRNVLLDFGDFQNKSSHGVDYTWSSDHEHCVVNGTVDAAWSFDFLWIYTDGLPESIKPGEQYNLVFESSDENKVAAHIWYLLPEDQKTDTRYFSSDVITIPEDCVGITVRLDVAENVVCDNVLVKLKLNTAVADSNSGGVGNHVSKMFSVGSSALTGWIYKHNSGTGKAEFDHVCPYDSTPYGNVAIALGIEQKNVQHILMESTGFLRVVYQSKGNILNKLLATDLSPFDYVLTLINRPDLGVSDSGFPLGDLNSEPSEVTIVGGVKKLLDYMEENAPNTTLILVGPPPSDQRASHRGQNTFTAAYGNGSSIGEVDIMLHRLAQQRHFIFIDWEDLNLSYWYYTQCDDGNVHPRDDATVRAMGMYLARQCNYTTSLAKVLKADLQS